MSIILIILAALANIWAGITVVRGAPANAADIVVSLHVVGLTIAIGLGCLLVVLVDIRAELRNAARRAPAPSGTPWSAPETSAPAASTPPPARDPLPVVGGRGAFKIMRRPDGRLQIGDTALHGKSFATLAEAEGYAEQLMAGRRM